MAEHWSEDDSTARAEPTGAAPATFMNRDFVVRNLLKVRPLAELGHAAAAGLMVWLAADHLPSSRLGVWAVLLLSVQVGRVLLRWSLDTRRIATAAALYRLRVSVLVLGLVWGGAVWPLWAQLPFNHFVLVVLTYCMLAGVWVLVFGVDSPSVYLFTVPLFALMLPAIVAHGLDDEHVAMFGMVLLYAAVTLVFYRHAHAEDLILHDMTERVQTSERRFRQLTENIPEVFYVSNGDVSRMLYVSPAYEQVWERPLEELYRNPRAFLDPVHPDDLGPFTTAIARVQQGEPQEIQFRLIRGDGSVRSILNRIVPVRDEAGTVYRHVGVARDVTDQWTAREVERQAHVEIERTAAAKMAFLANMSHEIRTPMSGILGMAELLRDTALTTEQHHSLDVITSSAEALLTILNDILDLSKIEAGELSLERIPFNLPGLVDATARLLSVRAFERGLELVCDCDGDVPQRVCGDPGRLRQVLTNLLANAVKFTSRGEVVLAARVTGGTAECPEIEFTVRDTGIGIPPEQMERIFAPFGQADMSTTRKYGGTGLGLSISRRLVRLMGGELVVRSAVGVGSTFSFRVAIPVERVAAEVLPEDRRITGLLHVRTLVVDDNATNRHVMGDTFRHVGAEVAEAASVDDAWHALATAARDNAPYRLLVSDVHMPGRDGFDLAQAIRNDPTLADLRIMLLTSAGRRGDGERCRELGVAAYLQKPVSRVELVESAMAAMTAMTKREGPAAGASLVTRHSIEETRRRLHVLLAEDNVVNQQVAASMLRKRGHRVEIAENGRQAVQAVAGGAFDVVLMDIQMPELDGLGATQEIRRLPGARRPRIIALTADVMPGERDRCLAAGMDDYLAKPFKAFQLFAAVEGWQSASGAARSEQEAGVVTAVDLTGFRADLRAAGIEETLPQVLAQYRRDAPARLAAIEDAVAAGDAAAMRRAAHALKSSAGTIRAANLAAVLLRMEAAARAGDAAAAAAELGAVQAAFEAVDVCLAAAVVPETT